MEPEARSLEPVLTRSVTPRVPFFVTRGGAFRAPAGIYEPESVVSLLRLRDA